MFTTLIGATALLNLVAAVGASPTSPSQKRDVIGTLGEGASDLELKFQPFLDFDTDGCYNTAAIDGVGKTNPGHDATGTPEGACRDPPQLENSNVYSRSKCNNGICAVMYEYYFEKDQNALGTYGSGHRHDWENVVVFSRENSDEIIWVAPSAHDNYVSGEGVLFEQGTHPLIVYHKDGGLTHCFRIANGDDQAGPENFSGSFYRSPLVGWDNWPSTDLRQQLFSEAYGGLKPKLSDDPSGDDPNISVFSRFLQKAAGDHVPGFDPVA